MDKKEGGLQSFRFLATRENKGIYSAYAYFRFERKDYISWSDHH